MPSRPGRCRPSAKNRQQADGSPPAALVGAPAARARTPLPERPFWTRLAEQDETGARCDGSQRDGELRDRENEADRTRPGATKSGRTEAGGKMQPGRPRRGRGRQTQDADARRRRGRNGGRDGASGRAGLHWRCDWRHAQRRGQRHDQRHGRPHGRRFCMATWLAVSRKPASHRLATANGLRCFVALAEPVRRQRRPVTSSSSSCTVRTGPKHARSGPSSPSDCAWSGR